MNASILKTGLLSLALTAAFVTPTFGDNTVIETVEINTRIKNEVKIIINKNTQDIFTHGELFYLNAANEFNDPFEFSYIPKMLSFVSPNDNFKKGCQATFFVSSFSDIKLKKISRCGLIMLIRIMEYVLSLKFLILKNFRM